MSAGNDFQSLQERIASLESQLQQMQSQLSRSQSGQASQGAASDVGAPTEPNILSPKRDDGLSEPAMWLVGAINQGKSVNVPGVFAAANLKPLAGGSLDFPTVQEDSVWWCESRFICATMECGGSGWC